MVHNKKIDRRLEERKVWLRRLSKHVKPGKIVEFGCGSGFVLGVLAEEFPDSIIIGIDKSVERLEKVVEKGLKNVIPVKADITHKIFPNSTFDTALFVGSLHEVFSYLGREKVEDSLRLAHNILKSDGVLIIQDFLKPQPAGVEIIFKNEKAQKKFFRFANEFRPRKVIYERTQDGVTLDIGDAVEFISKYHAQTEADWNEEMGETHFFFAEEDYKETAQRCGFIIKDMEELPKLKKSWVKTKVDVEFKFESQYRWIQVVLIKK